MTEEEGGAYFIERVEFPEVNVSEEKSSFKVQDLYLAGVYVRAIRMPRASIR